MLYVSRMFTKPTQKLIEQENKLIEQPTELVKKDFIFKLSLIEKPIFY